MSSRLQSKCILYLTSWKYGLSLCRCVVCFHVIWTATNFLQFHCCRTNLTPTNLWRVKSICFVVREGTLWYPTHYPSTPLDIRGGKEVTFRSVDSDKFALPDRRYLTFHAAVAKVIHMAGIAEYIEDISEKQESICVLSDESHVEYLDGLLRIAQRRA